MSTKAKIKQQLINDLKSIDSKLKMKSTEWNQEVRAAFNNTGSFCFENLVYSDYNKAQSLVVKFK